MEAVAAAIERLVEIALGVNPIEMLIQILATGLLIVVVKIFLWDKITAFLDKRREYVDSELTEASEKNEEAKALKKEAEEELNAAKEKARNIVDDAKSRAEDTEREIIADAKKEAGRIRKNAEKDLEHEVEIARNKIRDEMVDIASALTEKAINKQISEETYEQLLEEAIEEVRRQ